MADAVNGDDPHGLYRRLSYFRQADNDRDKLLHVGSA